MASPDGGRVPVPATVGYALQALAPGSRPLSPAAWESVAMNMEQFLAFHAPRLQPYLDAAGPDLVGNPVVDAFVCELEQALEQVEGPRPGARDLLPGEDTFLWCLDQLAIIADPRSGYGRHDPWVRHLLADLKELAPRLRARRGLPPGRQLCFTEHLDDDDMPWDDPDA